MPDTPTNTRTRRRPALERVLVTADRLFYEGGIQATGVDLIVEEAGVSKATLYAHFRTKDDLVVDYLDRRSSAWRTHLEAELERSEGDARARVGLVFDALGEWFRAPGYRGCPFINAEAEYGDVNPARDVTAGHRAWVLGMFEGLAAQAGASDPRRVARRLSILYDGAMASAQAEPEIDWAGEAREAALAVVDSAR